MLPKIEYLGTAAGLAPAPNEQLLATFADTGCGS